jgi:two-component system, NarL family, response regulator NreC
MPKIRVLIVDDHALVRSGFRSLLSAQMDMEVVGEAADGVVVEATCSRLTPDVVLMDLAMPGRGGISAIRDVRRACPDAKVVVVTMHEDEAYARQALLAGADGYVLKKSLSHELIKAIRAVHRGQQHITASLAEAVTGAEKTLARQCYTVSLVELLSSREREVLLHIALGYTNTEMAVRLHISTKTIETHRMHILSKLGLRTRADLVRFALEHGLVTAPPAPGPAR